MEFQECPVLEVQWGQTHRHMDRNVSKPFTVTLPKGESQLGTMTEHAAKLYLKGDPKPRFWRPRLVPFALKTAVEAELDRLLSLGIIEPVNYCEWAAPIVIVSKRNGNLRLCGDYNVMINLILELTNIRYQNPMTFSLHCLVEVDSTLHRHISSYSLMRSPRNWLLSTPIGACIITPNCHLEWHQLLPCFKRSLMSSFKCYRCYRQ